MGAHGSTREARGRGPSRALLIGLLALLLLGPSAVVLLTQGDDEAPPPRLQRLEGLPLPTDVAAGDQGVYVSSARRNRIIHLLDGQPPSEIGSFGAGAAPLRIASDPVSVWATGAATDTLTRVDSRLGARATARTVPVGASAVDVAASLDAVWVSNGPAGTITRIDPVSQRRVGAPIRTGRFPTALAIGARQYVWVVNSGDGTVARVDPREQLVIGRRVPVGRDPQDIAISAGTVWVANRGDGTLSRIDERSGRRLAPVRLGGAPSALAAFEGGVLVLDGTRGDVLRVDGRRRVTRVAHVGGQPAALAVSPSGLVWVVDPRSNAIVSIAP